MVAALACDITGVPRIAMSSITIAGQHSDEGLAKVGQTLADVAARIEHIVFGRPHSGTRKVDEREETKCQ
jgi:DNA-binding IclR family transcriptional regulator